MALTDKTRAEMREIMARYPQARSALLPMLHLVTPELVRYSTTPCSQSDCYCSQLH